MLPVQYVKLSLVDLTSWLPPLHPLPSLGFNVLFVSPVKQQALEDVSRIVAGRSNMTVSHAFSKLDGNKLEKDQNITASGSLKSDLKYADWLNTGGLSFFFYQVTRDLFTVGFKSLHLLLIEFSLIISRWNFNN